MPTLIKKKEYSDQSTQTNKTGPIIEIPEFLRQQPLTESIKSAKKLAEQSNIWYRKTLHVIVTWIFKKLRMVRSWWIDVNYHSSREVVTLFREVSDDAMKYHIEWERQEENKDRDAECELTMAV